MKNHPNTILRYRYNLHSQQVSYDSLRTCFFVLSRIPCKYGDKGKKTHPSEGINLSIETSKAGNQNIDQAA